MTTKNFTYQRLNKRYFQLLKTNLIYFIKALPQFPFNM